jgi:regulator of replication initiation timing
MQVNLTTACKMVGISRTTMYNRYVKTGVLSVNKRDKQVFIDVSELIRVFGNVKQLDEQGNVQEVLTIDDELHADKHDLTTENARLKAENEQLKARLDDKERHLQDMREVVRLLDHKVENQKPWYKFW